MDKKFILELSEVGINDIASSKNITLRRSLILVGYVIGSFIITIFMFYLIEKIKFGNRLLLIFSTIFGSVLIFFSIFDNVRYYYKDLKFLNLIEFYESMNREVIANNLNQLHFQKNRLKFIKELELRVLNVTGHWPNNSIPNFDNDYSSILLMMLDQKWLGLDH